MILRKPMVLAFAATTSYLLLTILIAPPTAAQIIVSGQVSISTPGLHVVDQNIAVQCGGTPLIEIATDGVTLDLQGHVLDCTDDSASLIASSSAAELTVRNGRLEGGASQTKPLIEIQAALSGGTRLVRLESLRLGGFKTGIDIIAGSSSQLSVEIDDCDLLSERGMRGVFLESVDSAVVTNSTIRLAAEGGSSPRQPVIGTVGVEVLVAELIDFRRNDLVLANQGIKLRTVDGGRIDGNSLRLAWRGIDLLSSDGVAIVGNSLSCHAECWSAIEIGDSSNENSIRDNEILGYPMGIVLQDSGNQYSGNRLMTHGPQIAIWDQSGGNVDGGDNVW